MMTETSVLTNYNTNPSGVGAASTDKVEELNANNNILFNCFLCRAEIVQSSTCTGTEQDSQMFTWDKSRSQSLCRVIQLDPSFEEILAQGKHCLRCLEIIADAEFSHNAITRLQTKLLHLEVTIKTLLVEHYQYILKERSQGFHDGRIEQDQLNSSIEQIVTSLGLKVESEEPVAIEERPWCGIVSPEEEKPLPDQWPEEPNPDRLLKLARRAKIFKRKILLKSGISSKLKSGSSKFKTIKSNFTPPVSRNKALIVSIVKNPDFAEEDEKWTFENSGGLIPDDSDPLAGIDDIDMPMEFDDFSFTLPLDDISCKKATEGTRVTAKLSNKSTDSTYCQNVRKSKLRQKSKVMSRFTKEGTSKVKFNMERYKKLKLTCNHDTCIGMNLEFNRTIEMREHIVRVHNGIGVENLYHCTKCQLQVNNSENLELHLLKIHEGFPSVPCSICGKLYWTSKSMERHIRTFHTKLQMNPKCRLCVKAFDTQELVDEHEKFHLNSDYRFGCVFCDKVCTNSTDLITHVHNEHEELPFHCDAEGCEKRYDTALKLRQHKNAEHNRKGKPHKCPLCPYVGRMPSTIKWHLLSHSDVKNFHCIEENCGESFKWKTQLNKHIQRKHGHEKRFPCHICSRTFQNSGLRAEHEVHHSDIRAYMCELCSSTFKTSNNLKNHTRQVHPRGKTTADNFALRKPRRARLPPVTTFSALQAT